MFKALLIKKEDENKTIVSIQDLDEPIFPDGDVVVDIKYSTLNYKDALAITSASPIIKRFPMIPGIDFSGEIAETSNENFKIGDKVILNGFGVGEKYWGGMAQKAKVKGSWLVKVPEQISLRQSMAIGTAGYTAMLGVLALEKNGISPEKGEVLVTGATGGVGSIAISLLNKLGYQVCASSGRREHYDYLYSLGAQRIINRSELSEKGRPLGKEIWSGAIDSVGSHTLANICASTKYGGIVAACGLAQGFDFPSTVMPFILRGVTLVGVDSVYHSIDGRKEAWNRLASDLNFDHLEKMIKMITLSDVEKVARDMLENKTHGRIVLDVNS